jgi:hypothetical protein
VDGIHWDDVFPHDAQNNYAGMVFGDNKYMMFSIITALSDDGVHWDAGPTPYDASLYNMTPRQLAFLDYGGGRFVAQLDGNNVRVSNDSGQTWWTAPAPPAGCTGGGLITGNGIAMFISPDTETACVSSDGAMTWTVNPIAGANLGLG